MLIAMPRITNLTAHEVPPRVFTREHTGDRIPRQGEVMNVITTQTNTSTVLLRKLDRRVGVGALGLLRRILSLVRV